jgi:hypothetical protein
MSEWYMDSALLQEDVDVLIIERTNKIESYGINLSFAILNEALYDLSKEGIARDEAIEWFEKDDYQYPFSFINIANNLNLDPIAIRDKIKKDCGSMLAFRKRTSYPNQRGDHGGHDTCEDGTFDDIA